MPNPPRLPWQRSPSDGFIAYPEGQVHHDRFATVARGIDSGGSKVWRWAARYGAALHTGQARSKQEAADAVTAVWPAMEAAARGVLEGEAAKHRLVQMVDRAEQDGDPEPFAVTTAPYQELIDVNWHLGQRFDRKRRAGEPTDALERVMGAISAELFRRRQRGDVPGG